MRNNTRAIYTHIHFYTNLNLNEKWNCITNNIRDTKTHTQKYTIQNKFATIKKRYINGEKLKAWLTAEMLVNHKGKDIYTPHTMVDEYR